MSPTDKALHIASVSRFPIAYDGDAFMYYGALCGLIVMSLLLIEHMVHIGKQMWTDRKKVKNAVFMLRMTFMMVCTTALIRIVPEVVYRIAWGEVTVNTLQWILAIKEGLNIVAVGTLICWILIHRYFEPLWTLRLNAPASQVWGGNKQVFSKALVLTLLSALLAGSITIFKAFG
ncbi:MAG: hypothetical protein EOO77_31835 [Oxalobacteraceae bacterium]|nr:MAG: hypothetical protein EOO77_31835 [Oxalobacteraceae bacterium]